jgi:cupin-like protein
METKLQAGRAIQRRATKIEEKSIREIERHREPLVFTGGIEHWPARSKWTFAWLGETHGDVLAPVEWLRYHHKKDGGVERVGKVEPMRLRDYLDALVRDDGSLEGGYLIGRDLLRLIPELRGDTLFPDVQLSERLTERLFFMGPRGAFTQLHYDRALNLHAMIVGRKRWQLYAPDQSRRLRPARYESAWSVMSEHDLAPHGGQPDQLPGSVQPDYDFVLEAGEVLYLPYGWWHRVETLAPSIATNFWWWSWPLLIERGPALVGTIAKNALLVRIKRYEHSTVGRNYRSGGMRS